MDHTQAHLASEVRHKNEGAEEMEACAGKDIEDYPGATTSNDLLQNRMDSPTVVTHEEIR